MTILSGRGSNPNRVARDIIPAGSSVWTFAIDEARALIARESGDMKPDEIEALWAYLVAGEKN